MNIFFNANLFIYINNYYLLYEVTFFLPTTSIGCALPLSTGDPGRQRQRNGYVTALRCPSIYLIILLNEVGEAPKPPGLHTMLVCNWLTTVYLWFLHGAWKPVHAVFIQNQETTKRRKETDLCLTEFYNQSRP